MRSLINILTLILLLTASSCDGIKRKSDAALAAAIQKAAETKEKINHKKNQLSDKIFPIYDNIKADTESNKRRFKEHLQVDLTPDVKEIYAYGDFMGIDYKVLIAFKCDPATIDRIVKAKKMTSSTDKHDFGLTFAAELPWWDKKMIEQLKPYKAGKEYEYWEYLWYDSINKIAYYQEFSL